MKYLTKISYKTYIFIFIAITTTGVFLWHLLNYKIESYFKAQIYLNSSNDKTLKVRSEYAYKINTGDTLVFRFNDNIYKALIETKTPNQNDHTFDINYKMISDLKVFLEQGTTLDVTVIYDETKISKLLGWLY